jgi:hypothetical protein
MGIEALLLSQVITISGSTGQVVTKQADGSLALQDAAGGGLSGTGSVDNAVLRADGTGGATLQNSAFVIPDNATASPNNTVNHASIQATGGTTNVSVSIVPKGTGAFTLQVPDGTSAGGNARGENAVDFQVERGNTTQVSTGTRSFLVATSNCIASGTNSAVLTSLVTNATGAYSTAFGSVNSVASGGQSMVVCGDFTTASGGRAFSHGTNPGFGGQINASQDGFCINGAGAGSVDGVFGCGPSALAHLYAQKVYASGRFAAHGDAQVSRLIARNKTTNTTPTTLFLNGSSLRLVIPAGKVFAFTARITGIKSDGTAVAEYVRKGVIKRISNTTSLVGSIETIGTDIEDNASTDVAITADDTNEALQINVTGIASETWRWVAVVEGVEIAYGT